ncbi:hypothetical protein IMCC20628_02698 [Hoeflea sp. IMCC20628]|uniref:hypothetical protein n=1 Tax=Hoeflea sp. IMCC20628 TaxID=1620421 RepID=UPI00063AA3DF|nr:hypothetical protein [Hoeflea sp. IMCC20628]AKI01394.1 hypothetical protein IMCC20628_02698 [Hoeflea sp. IMCC20628]
MTLLSICIPVMAPDVALAGTVRQMLQSRRDDYEILIADFTGGEAAGLSGLAEELNDTRMRLITPGPNYPTTPETEISRYWNLIIPETRGAWITFINSSDYADPGICEVIRALLKRVPEADALSWGRACYVPPAERAGLEIAKIPTGSSLTLPEQTDMMRSQFYWDGASDRPACHFGVWHGAVRRDLLERTREAFSDAYFEQAEPATDSTCKTVMLARRMVFWERPLSVQCAAGGQLPAAADQDKPPFPDFPFSINTGIAAAVALTIEAFKRRYGIELDGWEDSFVKACAHDCETAATGEQFHARKAAYAKAIANWRGKRALAGFKPEFKRKPKLPRFQGVKDAHLHFDMAMDDTQTAAEFYRLIDAMLFPGASARR